jgi:ankyrin repeat protein
LNLEQQKKQARELLRALRAGDAEAIARLRTVHTRWAGVDEATTRQLAALHDAQFVLAREQGFASWPKLKAYAEPAADSRHTRLFVADVDWIADRARGLLITRLSAGPAALEQIREWHPRFADASDDDIRSSPFTEEDARIVYAREHGFATWQELADRVEAIQQGRAEEPFRAAFQAIEAQNFSSFEKLLREHPEIVKARGTNGNTLLNLVGSRKCEMRFTDALLTAGADPNEGNDRGWTPLHQAGYGNQVELAARLIAAGANPELEAHGAGGTPLIAALFWGHREVADFLATQSVAPGNLRVAAGLGNLAMVEDCFAKDGKLAKHAGAARGFYRPHSGFPDWKPSNDPQEILDEALVWAAKSNRVGVFERLIRAGARIDADPYRGTALIWAAVGNHAEAVNWLIDHGANVNQKATFGGLSHGQGITALHLAAQYGHLEMVKLLVSRGADIKIKEDLYNADAAGAGEYFGHHAVRDYLRSL